LWGRQVDTFNLGQAEVTELAFNAAQTFLENLKNSKTLEEEEKGE